MRIFRVLDGFTFLFFISPFIVLLFKFKLNFEIDILELGWAVKNTLLQSFFSAFGSLVLGFFCSFGILILNQKFLRPIFEIMCLVPNFLPPLFTLVATLNFVDPFPTGVIGISIVHMLINFGLVCVLSLQLIETRMGGWIELAWIEGASLFSFTMKGIWPSLRKDLWQIFLFIFAICFASFSIPLIVGGGGGTTLEVLIYEKIRIASDWGGAIILCLLQTLMIFLVSILASRGRVQFNSHRIVNYAYFKGLFSTVSLLVFFIVNAVLIKGFVDGLVDGFSQFGYFQEFKQMLLWQTLGSLTLGFCGGVLCLIFLFWIAWIKPSAYLNQFLNGFISPSTSLIGVAFLVLSPNDNFWPLFKIPLAFLILNFSSLYRLSWSNWIESLNSQREVAKVLGASATQIFCMIEFPQLQKKAFFLTGLFSVWLMGDFALARILAQKDITLAMFAQTLLSSYRISQASLISFLVFLLSVILFLFWIGVGHVIGRKFKI